MKKTIILILVCMLSQQIMAQTQNNNTQTNSSPSSSIGENNNSDGQFSFTSGEGLTVMGDYSTVLGQDNIGSQNGGFWSLTTGLNCETGGNYSITLGEENTTIEGWSLTTGLNCSTLGEYSVNFGENNINDGNWSFTQGYNCNNSSDYSVSLGKLANSNAYCSFSFGESITTNGSYAVSMGSFGTNSGGNSMIFGDRLYIAQGINNSYVFGKGNIGGDLSGFDNSLIVGINSNLPTLTVYESWGNITTGKVGVGTGQTSLDAKFTVLNYQSIPDEKIVKFFDSDNQQLFIVTNISSTNTPKLNTICKDNDIAILFSDNQSDNVNSGLIIGSYAEQEAGIRINNENEVGIGTSDFCSKLHVYGGTAIGYNASVIAPYLGLLVNGQFGINTDNNTLSQLPNCMLAVKGAIYANEFKIKLYDKWSDYVFDDLYKLLSLYDIESFIKQNHHLPDVPSAQEIEKNGINVGEMSEILLKKIEELTLHMIELNNQSEQIQNDIEILKP
ncbi:MAG: hypothetical protein K9J13_08025 [Saprospiraceae bacterium]|nr:hypothetical protein [Saprospiraceae bacterium]